MKSPRFSHCARLVFASAVVLVAGCASPSGDTANAADGGESKEDGQALYVITEADTTGLGQAIFAGGCFLCTEKDFQEIEGVHTVIS